MRGQHPVAREPEHEPRRIYDRAELRRAEVLLVDDAVFAADKSLDAAVAVSGRPGDHRMAGDHVAVDKVVKGAARRRWSLRGQDAEVIAVVRLQLLARTPSQIGVFRESVERGNIGLVFRRPVEAVVAPGGRDDPARVFTQAVAVAIQFEIFVLGRDIGFARLNGAELVVPDPAIGHFLLSFSYVEAPSRIGLDERQRQGPTVFPDA
jgi:hypothetical protein